MARSKLNNSIDIDNKQSNTHIESIKYVTIRSNATYPIPFIYNNETTFIDPMGIIKNLDKSKLGSLPKSIRIVN